MARGDQVFRQWSILHRLKSGRCSRRDLAQEFGVSLKTISRDITALSLFPIVETHEGIDVYYEMMPGSRASGFRFEPEEVVALMFAYQQAAGALGGTPYKEALDGLMKKLEQQQRGYTYRRLEHLPEVYQVSPTSDRTIRSFEEDLLERLIGAALAKNKIKITYFTVYRQALTERVVEPFVIYQSAHGLRLIAFCHMRKEVRFFSINKIRELVTLDETFDLDARRFDLEALLNRSFDDMCSGPVVDVKLHIRFPTAHWARDRNYHPTQHIEDVEDGIVLSFRAAGMPAIVARVMGLGPDCRVLAPAELQQKVIERARQIMARYDDEK